MWKKRAAFCLAALFLFFQGGMAMALELKSSAFAPSEAIPRQYTCEGKDISPELSWEGEPATTESFALICDDPDAPMGTWVHWVVYNIPAEVHKLPQGVVRVEISNDGMRQGFNDFQRIGYGGPCPPPGKPHRYFFKLYALNTTLHIQDKVTKESLLLAMKGHIVAEATLMGTYKR